MSVRTDVSTVTYKGMKYNLLPSSVEEGSFSVDRPVISRQAKLQSLKRVTYYNDMTYMISMYEMTVGHAYESLLIMQQ